MRRRKRGQIAEGLSLVPMTDMLTNTVGITLFILAFTVLSTGGVTIAKRLPLEHEGKESPAFFVCWGHRVLPLESDKLSDRFVKPLGRPTYDTVDRWVEKFNKAKAEDDFFVMTGEGDVSHSGVFFNDTVRLTLTSKFSPKPGAGDLKADLRKSTSTFAAYMKTLKEKNKFAYFIVYPDNISEFMEARSIAAEVYQVGTGWGPNGADEPIRVILAGGGGGGVRPVEQ
jgi:hypothetical protein